jgi:hypothetical protein
MFLNKSQAYRKGGHVYTLEPCVSPDMRSCGFKHVGYRDGERCGFFKTRKDFEEFVEHDPVILPPLGPHAEATFKAQTWANMEATIMLEKLIQQAQSHSPEELEAPRSLHRASPGKTESRGTETQPAAADERANATKQEADARQGSRQQEEAQAARDQQAEQTQPQQAQNAHHQSA